MVTAKQNLENNIGLSDIQISMLRLFDQGIEEDETLEVRKMLMDFFDQKLQNELNNVLQHKQYTNEDYHKMLADDKFVTK